MGLSAPIIVTVIFISISFLQSALPCCRRGSAQFVCMDNLVYGLFVDGKSGSEHTIGMRPHSGMGKAVAH